MPNMTDWVEFTSGCSGSSGWCGEADRRSTVLMPSS